MSDEEELPALARRAGAVPLGQRPVVVGDVMSPDRQAWLAKALEAGRLVILAMTDPAQVATLNALTGDATGQSSQVTAEAYAMLSNLDFEHPILSSFVWAISFSLICGHNDFGR